MKKWVLGLVLFLAILFEGTAFSLPLVLNVLLVFYVIYGDSFVFPAAFFSGILLDLLLVRIVGQSSLFFITFLFIISLYESKFETKTFPFVLISSFLGSLISLEVFGYQNIFPLAVLNAFLSGFLFLVISHFEKLSANKSAHLRYSVN